MEILDKKLQKHVRIISKRLGVTEGEIVRRAISSYTSNFEEFINLQGELHAWDVLSAKTMRKHNF